MKKFKSLLSVLSAITILSAGSFNVLQVNAEAKLLGTDTNGNEIWGGVNDILVGFDEEGNPIIEDTTPEGVMQIPEESASLPTPGDINNNNSVDLTDLTELSLYLIGDKTFNDFEMFGADTNGDNEVNLADLAHLKQYIMSKDVKLG